MNLFIDGIAYDGVNGRLALKLPSLPPLELNVEDLYVFSDFGNFPSLKELAIRASVPGCTHNAAPSSPA
ncbi:MAG: hypothetical protein AAB268_05720 [Elusimicrobiota bacterium]